MPRTSHLILPVMILRLLGTCWFWCYFGRPIPSATMRGCLGHTIRGHGLTPRRRRGSGYTLSVSQLAVLFDDGQVQLDGLSWLPSPANNK